MRSVDVVLLKDVDRLGTQGAVVHVKPGFARNYLLPQGLAELASPARLKMVETIHRQQRRKRERLQAEYETLKRKLEQQPLTLRLTVGAGEQVFGSVTAHDIAQALAQAGFEVEKRAIRLEDPIKTLGDHAVPVRLHPNVTATLKVSVVNA